MDNKEIKCNCVGMLGRKYEKTTIAQGVFMTQTGLPPLKPLAAVETLKQKS